VDSVLDTEDRHPLDSGKGPDLLVEKRPVRTAPAAEVLPDELHPVDAQRALETGLGRMGGEDVIDDRGHQHQHNEGEADAEQTDEGEELPSRENAECELELCLHATLLNRPAGRRTGGPSDPCARRAWHRASPSRSS